MTSETVDDIPGGHRRFKRPSASLHMHRSPASHPGWVLLNRTGARRDDFPAGDRTTSAMSCTSKGEEISVSFEIVEPPDTSFLTADLPRASTTPPTIIAAHRDVVLLAIRSSCSYPLVPLEHVVDLFVYQASRPSSLLLLPSAGAPVIYSHLITMGAEGFGIMSCTSKNDDDSPPFVIAYLEMCAGAVGAATMDARLFRSGSSQWEVFKNLHVHGAPDDYKSPLQWWSTDAVVRYGRRYMIFVDYYHGMVLMDLLSELETVTTKSPPPPRLRYVPLPVDRVENPEDLESGRRECPKAFRSVCVTRYGIKFVSIDRQHWSSFGIGNRHTLTWSHRFRITTWSLREEDCAWRNDVTMHQDFFWDTFDGGDRFPFPHVQPQFPVVNVDNPDVVIFRLDERLVTRPKWMIEVDLRKKVLLAATNCSKQKSDNAEDIKMKSGFDPIPSELQRYLDGGQAGKKRRQ